MPGPIKAVVMIGGRVYEAAPADPTKVYETKVLKIDPHPSDAN